MSLMSDRGKRRERRFMKERRRISLDCTRSDSGLPVRLQTTHILQHGGRFLEAGDLGWRATSDKLRDGRLTRGHSPFTTIFCGHIKLIQSVTKENKVRSL